MRLHAVCVDTELHFVMNRKDVDADRVHRAAWRR